MAIGFIFPLELSSRAFIRKAWRTLKCWCIHGTHHHIVIIFYWFSNIFIRQIMKKGTRTYHYYKKSDETRIKMPFKSFLNFEK
jgi:hypothetical protein